VETLIGVRENAEQVVHAVEILLLNDDDGWTEEDEREFQKHRQELKAKGDVYVEIPDEEMPF
jgi:hypothetical protein